MAITNMLVPVGDIANDEAAIGTALQLALEFGGYAECMFVAGDVSDVIPASHKALSAEADLFVVTDWEVQERLNVAREETA